MGSFPHALIEAKALLTCSHTSDVHKLYHIFSLSIFEAPRMIYLSLSNKVSVAIWGETTIAGCWEKKICGLEIEGEKNDRSGIIDIMDEAQPRPIVQVLNHHSSKRP